MCPKNRGGFSKVTMGKRKNQEDSVYSGFGPTSGPTSNQNSPEVAIKCISKEDMRNGSESEELVAREIQTFATVDMVFHRQNEH